MVFTITLIDIINYFVTANAEAFLNCVCVAVLLYLFTFQHGGACKSEWMSPCLLITTRLNIEPSGNCSLRHSLLFHGELELNGVGRAFVSPLFAASCSQSSSLSPDTFLAFPSFFFYLLSTRCRSLSAQFIQAIGNQSNLLSTSPSGM